MPQELFIPNTSLHNAVSYQVLINGQVANPTDKPQPVPQIRAELQDAQGRIVYSWSISPPISELAPHQSATFNSAEVDVPRGARKVHLDFGKSL